MPTVLKTGNGPIVKWHNRWLLPSIPGFDSSWAYVMCNGDQVCWEMPPMTDEETEALEKHIADLLARAEEHRKQFPIEN